MKKWKLTGIILLLFAVVLSGCGNQSTEMKEQEAADSSSKYWLYELNNSETELVRKAYEPADIDTEKMVGEITQMLPENSQRYLHILMDNVNILDYDLIQNVLKLNFSAEYSEMGAVREILVRAALVKNFIQVPGISAVQIEVSGKPLKDSKGNEVGMLTGKSFADCVTKDEISYQFARIKLYFATEDGTGLISEERNIYYVASLPLERVVMEQLMKGPSEEGRYPTLSDELKLLSVVISDGICYINFDESFISEALTIQPETTIYSIVNSIVDACGVEKVHISVGGESNKTFREIMELDQFFEKNDQIVVSEDTKEEKQEKKEESEG